MMATGFPCRRSQGHPPCLRLRPLISGTRLSAPSVFARKTDYRLELEPDTAIMRHHRSSPLQSLVSRQIRKTG